MFVVIFFGVQEKRCKMKKIFNLLMLAIVLSAIQTIAFASDDVEKCNLPQEYQTPKILIYEFTDEEKAALNLYQKPESGPYKLTDDDKAMMSWGKLQRTYTQLNLSNKQTIKAQEIIIKGMQEINAIQYDIKAKEGQIEVIKRTRIAPAAQKMQIDAVNAEISNLNKKIYAVYHKSTADFEATLTKKQLSKYKELY